MQLECSCLIDPRTTPWDSLHNNIACTATHRVPHTPPHNHQNYRTIASIADRPHPGHSGQVEHCTYSSRAWHVSSIAHSPPAHVLGPQATPSSRRGTHNNTKSAPQLAALHMLPLRFSIATFNLRGISDRWTERHHVLKQCIRDMDADVFCFQEVLTGGYAQDAELLGPLYEVYACPAALHNLQRQGGFASLIAGTVNWLAHTSWFGPLVRAMPLRIEQYREAYRVHSELVRLARDIFLIPFFGNSLATRLVCAEEAHQVLVLGDFRAAQRVLLRLPLASSASKTTTSRADDEPALHVWVVNMHLDHDHPDRRAAQGEAVVSWMEDAKGRCDAIVLCGDLNASPPEPLHALLRQRGYRSAHTMVHGNEPQGTWPSGIEAPLAEEGPFECLDYVYLWEAPGIACRILSAELKGALPAADDPTLFPSDHIALKVHLEIDHCAHAPGD